MTKREKAQKQRWMAEFENAVKRAKPELIGTTLNWHDAEYLYLSNHTVQEATEKYLKVYK